MGYYGIWRELLTFDILLRYEEILGKLKGKSRKILNFEGEIF